MKVEKQYTLREVADLLHMSVDAMRSAVWKRRIGYTRIGSPRHGRIRISESDLQAFLERHRVAALGEKVGSTPRKTRKNGS
jgi:excisionase family DNA binding protein